MDVMLTYLQVFVCFQRVLLRHALLDANSDVTFHQQLLIVKHVPEKWTETYQWVLLRKRDGNLAVFSGLTHECIAFYLTPNGILFYPTTPYSHPCTE